jgi:hypothetical protein
MGDDRDTYWVTLGNTQQTSWNVDGTYEGCFDVTETDTYGQSSAQDDGVCIDECANASGDVNDDGALNVMDVVLMINFVLSGDGFDTCQLETADYNGDDVVNILDVVSLINTILGGTARAEDASSATILSADNIVKIKADGYIGAVQMTLTHDATFSLDITSLAYVSSYHTEGNTTKLIVAVPESDELFTVVEGDYQITEVIVVNSTSEIDAVVAPQEFSLSPAYPNPFNPVTTMQIGIPVDGFASVKVYDLLGKEVATLIDGNLKAKVHTFSWDAASASTGVYFVRAIAGDDVQTHKVMLMK